MTERITDNTAPGLLASIVMDDFERLGKKASYHYADDSGKEWGTGNTYRDQALTLFDAHPDLQPAMRKLAATEFLWSLTLVRPHNKENTNNVAI